MGTTVPTHVNTHPTACPPWCKDQVDPLAHHFGPTMTWHWSPQHTLDNPRPLEGEPRKMLFAELARPDEDGTTGPTSLFIQAQGDIDLTPAEADDYIDRLQGFVDTLRVLRKQMDHNGDSDPDVDEALRRVRSCGKR